MSDLWTMGSATAEATEERDTTPPPGRDRRIRRPRSLPGSRAVVGALLVTAAAVGVFAAYLDANAEPASSYVVALTDVPIGTVLTEEALTDGTQFGLVAVDLPGQTARGAIPAEQALALAGQVTAAPLSPGDLITRSGLLGADTADGTSRLSFSIPATRAVGGALAPGDVIDLVATFGSGGDVVTRYVAREVVLTDVAGADGSLGASSELTLTLALTSDEMVLDVAQAIDVANVFVVRSPLEVDGREDLEEEVVPPVDVDDEPDEPAEPDEPDEPDATDEGAEPDDED